LSNNLPPDFTLSQTWIPELKLIAPHTSSDSAVDRSKKKKISLPSSSRFFLGDRPPTNLWIAGCVGSATKLDIVLKENSHFIKN
jgi:hypothetical protein